MKGDKLRLAWIVPTVDAGGIGPVALETARAAGETCDVTVIETHGAPRRDERADGIRRVAMDMAGTGEPATCILDWLKSNWQDVIFTNGVSHLDEIFPHIPQDVAHVAVLHDAGRRYRTNLLSYARHLSGVVAVSDYVCHWIKNDLRAIGYSGVLRRIYNGTSYPPDVERGARGGPLRLLFIGGAIQKGIVQIIAFEKALREVGGKFELTVVADRTEWLQRKFAGAGFRIPLAWKDRVPRDELWPVYAQHDVLLALSAGEAFGMVTIEAMGMGCVPVSYKGGSGTSEIIEPGVSGLLVGYGPRSLAAALAVLTPGQLDTMAAAAAVRARTYFNAARTAREYVQLAREVATSQGAVARPGSFAAESSPRLGDRVRTWVANAYHALPMAVRKRIRRALGPYPDRLRWFRERF